MKTLISAAIIGVLAMPALAHQKTQDGHHHHAHTHEQKVAATKTIVVSCYRGPWEDVIWDHPNAVFIDSLVEIGYDINTATSIGERICRDDALVGNSDGLKTEMKRIYREVRP